MSHHAKPTRDRDDQDLFVGRVGTAISASAVSHHARLTRDGDGEDLSLLLSTQRHLTTRAKREADREQSNDTLQHYY